MSRQALAREYDRADVLCLPIVQEGFGIAFLEAMADGRTIFAARAAVSEQAGVWNLCASPAVEDAKTAVQRPSRSQPAAIAGGSIERCQHHCDWRMPCSHNALSMKLLADLRVLLLGWASTTFLVGQANAGEVIRFAFAVAEVEWRTVGLNHLSGGRVIRGAGLSRFAKVISL